MKKKDEILDIDHKNESDKDSQDEILDFANL